MADDGAAVMATMTVQCPGCGSDVPFVVYGVFQLLRLVDGPAAVRLEPEQVGPPHSCPRRPGPGSPLPVPAAA